MLNYQWVCTVCSLNASFNRRFCAEKSNRSNCEGNVGVFQTREDAVISVFLLGVMSACGAGIPDTPHVMIMTRKGDVIVRVGQTTCGLRGRLRSCGVSALNGEVTAI
jgi:hypothetical protein